MKGLCCRYGQLGVFIVCLFFTACIPEDIELPYRVQSVTTGSSMNVTELSVTLSGNVTLIDSENITCGVIYGTSSNLSSSNGAKALTNAKGEFEVKISGLKANTTYYYRAYAVDAGRYKYGEVLSFTTKKNVAVTTGEAVGITTNSVNIKGTVNHAEKSLVCGIVYGTSSELSYKNGTIKSTTSSGDFSVNITGLNANTIYYYCAYVVVNGAYRYGGIRSFSTKQEVTITTNAATDITDSGATLGGTINNSDKSLTCGIIYGTSSSLSSSSGTKKSTTSSGDFFVNITGLNSNTTYYYRAYAVVDGEYKYGDVSAFHTIKEVTVSTGGATNITDSGATLGGTINNSDKSLTCGIIYGTSSSLSSSSGTKKSTTSDGDFSLSLTGLSENTTYYYRAYVVVDGEYFYGDTKSFKTKGTDLCPDANHVHAVDLGLSVKWACCNVGASVPEGYGGYYAWGETEEKSSYTEDTYKYCNDRDGNGWYSEYEYQNIGSNISGTSYDVAHVKWSGGWRMPTRDEIKELCEKCSWEWTSVNGVGGRKVTGPNGNSIFLPAAGYRGGTEVYVRGSSGYYWSGTPYDEDGSYYAYYLYFGSGNGYWDFDDRYNGRSVRPVTDK